MKKNKKCNFCNIIKSLEYFHRDRTTSDKHTARCIACTKLYYKNYYYKKANKKPYFPYKSIQDPRYIKDKREVFNKNGNGWWLKVLIKRGRSPLAGKPKR